MGYTYQRLYFYQNLFDGVADRDGDEFNGYKIP